MAGTLQILKPESRYMLSLLQTYLYSMAALAPRKGKGLLWPCFCIAPQFEGTDGSVDGSGQEGPGRSTSLQARGAVQGTRPKTWFAISFRWSASARPQKTPKVPKFR